MKGDFSRNTFDRTRHYSRVLMQQGRVQLDADWNEQTAIVLHYLRNLATDLFGSHAGPADGSGFEVITKQIKNRHDKLNAIEPNDEPRRQVLNEALEGGNLIVGPGHYYVKGMLVENENAVLYTEQPGYPFSDETKVEALQKWQSGMLVYLDVWERHITYVEDDHIREVALGSPDTCSRAQVVWQVKVLSKPECTEEFKCDSLKTLLAREFPKLRARARLDKPPTNLCVISPESRYRGVENQLYRVEVHKGGTAAADDGTGATFKWSRENGSVTFPIRTLSATTATLEHLGRDEHLSLKSGDWVEIVDETIALGERAGPLARVESVDPDELTVILKYAEGAPVPLPGYTGADVTDKHPLLRRWDHLGDPVRFDGALPVYEQDDVDKGWINLEDGVQIWFAQGGEYRSGDYWLIPARVATGDVEWLDELDPSGNPKVDSDGNPIPASLEPSGPRHYYAPLFLSVPEAESQDCRCRIKRPDCLGPTQDTD